MISFENFNEHTENIFVLPKPNEDNKIIIKLPLANEVQKALNVELLKLPEQQKKNFRNSVVFEPQEGIKITSDEERFIQRWYHYNLPEETEKEENKFILMSKFSPVPFAEALLRKQKIKYDKNKNLIKYNKSSGLWESNVEQSLRNHLRTHLLGEEQQKKNYVEEILSYIKDVTYDENFELKPNPYVIAFNNQVFDLVEDKFRDFSENDYLTTKLNIVIDENMKECPKIDNFFSESIGQEFKEMLYEIIAYSLLDGAYPYQKLFFVFGPAGTGKSVYLNLLEKFLGNENYCSVEPISLIKDQHATTQLLFKKANIVSDINYSDLQDITQLKKLTGEDTVKIREMYKNPYNKKLYTKHLFSGNGLPSVREKTKAWYRRLYLIPFSNIIPQESRNPFLLNNITSKEELQGLAYKSLQCLRNLYKRNFVFSFDPDEDKMGEIYEEFSNPVLMFIRENCIEGRDEFTFKWEFEERLNNWLKSNHFPPQTKSQINQYMKEKYSESNRPYFDKTYRVWTGLRWKRAEETSSLNQFNHFNGLIKKVYRYRGILKNPLNSLNSLNESDNKQQILNFLKEYEKENGKSINLNDLRNEFLNINNLDEILEILQVDGLIFEERHNSWRWLG